MTSLIILTKTFKMTKDKNLIAWLVVVFTLLFLVTSGKSQDSICIDIKKVEGLVKKAKKADFAEQQISSLLKLDSVYIDLSRQFAISAMSQQSSISDLIEINKKTQSIMDTSFKSIVATQNTITNDLMVKNQKLSKKNRDKNIAIVILSSVVVGTTILAVK